MFALQAWQAHGGTEHRNIKTDCSGFSLIEVLVAGTVFSLGLAGFASLMLTSVIGSGEAHREGIASMAAASLAEQITLNPVGLHRYLEPPEYVSRICSADTLCTPVQQADYDFKLWQLELSDSIHSASGLVCRDETPNDGHTEDSLCDGTGSLVIKIFWHALGKGENGGLNSRRFTLQVP